MAVRICPICQGKARVQHIPPEAMYVDTSDIHDCPLCVDGEIVCSFSLSEEAKKQYDKKVIESFPQYCAI